MFCFGCMRQADFPDLKRLSAEPLLSGKVHHKNIHINQFETGYKTDFLFYCATQSRFVPQLFFGAELIGWAVSSGGESSVVFSEGGEQTPPLGPISNSSLLFSNLPNRPKKDTTHPLPPLLPFLLFVSTLDCVPVGKQVLLSFVGSPARERNGVWGVCGSRGGGSSDVFIGKLLYYVLWLMTKHLVLGSAWTISSETGQLVAMHIFASEHSGSLASQSRTSAHYWKEHKLDILRILQVCKRFVLKATVQFHPWNKCWVRRIGQRAKKTKGRERSKNLFCAEKKRKVAFSRKRDVHCFSIGTTLFRSGVVVGPLEGLF